MSDKNLLITIIDTNPVWWGLQSSGFIKSDSIHKSANNLLAQTNVFFKLKI